MDYIVGFLIEKTDPIQGVAFSAKDIVSNIIQVGTRIVNSLPYKCNNNQS